MAFNSELLFFYQRNLKATQIMDCYIMMSNPYVYGVYLPSHISDISEEGLSDEAIISFSAKSLTLYNYGS